MSTNETAVFIDTNIYLRFYAYSTLDLEVLDKLNNTLKDKEIDLYLPQQVIDEFDRKREKTIADALCQLNTNKISIPTLCKNLQDNYSRLVDAMRKFEASCKDTSDSIKKEALLFNLKADVTIKDIFSSARIINLDDGIFEKAQRRNMLGNPPGKGKNIGDAINWESLLSQVSNDRKLIIVSNDSDYADDLDKKRPRSFLQEEWRKIKNNDLQLYDQLDVFLKEYLNLLLNDKINDEINILISELSRSACFSTTHVIIKQLNGYVSSFSQDQIIEISNACQNNDQVKWIITDSDIKEFVIKIIDQCQDSTHKQELGELIESV